MHKIGKLLIPMTASVLLISSDVNAQTSPGKIGVLHVYNAIAQCAEGKVALSEFQKKAEAKQAELEKQNGEIQGLQKQLSDQVKALNEESKAALSRSIDSKTTALQRATEDARKEFGQMQQEIINRIGNKLVPVVQQYAAENKFTLIIDSSNQSSILIYFDPATDVTEDIIKRFDSSSAAPPGQTAPSNPKPTTPIPPAPTTPNPTKP